jgi:hypothetical protein
MSRRRSIGSRFLFTLVLAVLPGMAVAQPWAGPERQVSPAGLQPEVAVDGQGNFIVVWVDDKNAGRTDILAQRFSAAGPKLGEPFQVNTTAEGYQLNPSVAADRAGNFVVVWQGGSSTLDNRGGDGDGPGIHGQLFGANGTKRGGEFRVNLVTEGSQTRPKVAMAPDGRFAVAWDDERASLPFVSVALRAFAADGRPFRYQVQPETHRDGREPLIAMSTEGIILGWTESADCGRFCVDFFPYVQVFKADALPRDRRRLMDSSGSGIMRSVLAPRGNGDYLALWDLGSGDLRGQRVTTSGQKTGKVFDLHDPVDDERVQFQSAAMDAAGRFVVIWELGEPVNNLEGELVGRFFESRRGKPQGPLFPVNIHPSTDPQHGAVALADDGTFAVVWLRENSVDRPAGVVRRWFRRQ